MTAPWLALAGATAAVLAAGDLLACFLPGALERAPRVVRAAAGAVDAAVRIGREGRDPGAAERRRLLLAGAAALFAGALVAAGPLVAVGLAAAGPWLTSRALAARRARYRRAVDEGMAGLAVSVADALGGGHSLRGALAEAAGTAAGPPGHELRRVAAELAAGARTEHALEAMRTRVPSARVDAVVAACLLQRRAGGDLARLLRDCARAFEDESRLLDEVRAATAQARFTGVVVVLLPLGGALLAELARPGFLLGLWDSFLTAWLVSLALALQVVAAVLIRRLGRVRW
jgi:tight adherence protein B